MTGEKAYVEHGLATVASQTAVLATDIDAGDLAAARGAWLTAHLSYERLGSAYGMFGGYDDAIDAFSEALEADLPFLSRFEGADPVDVVRRHEIAARLNAALEGLPSYHRAVIVMREIDGLSYDEMATVMGVSKGTIMSRLFHARQKLQRSLSDYYREQVGVRPSGEVQAPGSDR